MDGELEAKSPEYAHLHVHSEYSLADGSIRIKELVKKTVERGHTHVALTDHGNMHGAIEFYQACKGSGITPIIGCEIYHRGSDQSLAYAKDKGLEDTSQGAFHLVVLAKDTKGYQSLLKVVSSGYTDGNLNEVPIVPESALDEYPEQLVALTSCLRGEFAFWVKELRKASGSGELSFDLTRPGLKAPYEGLSAYVAMMKQRFGEENFYVELINNNLAEQKRLIPDLAAAADHFQVPLVASADAHYLDKEFADTHALAVAIKNGITLNHIRERQRSAHFHLANDEEMKNLFAQYPQAITNTMEVARKCSGIEIKMDTYYLPKIDLGTNESPVEALERIAKEGLEERFSVLAECGVALTDDQKKVYWERLGYELKVIVQMGFPDYFLIVQDFINWAKRNEIPVGPGRGSGAGSLVAYALKITDLDPLPYNLIFERFLNPERVSMPDFDVDFCQWRREEVIQYCVEKYGFSNVAQITTFGKMQAKGAVKSVGRAMNLGYSRVDQFTKLFPPDLGITLTDALEQEPRLKEEMEKDEALKDCMNYALKLEGLASHTSVHAAGLVISDGDMTGFVPVYTTDGKSYITQYEMKPTEKVGLVKFDFLGLKTLTVIDTAVRLVKKNKDPHFNIGKIPLDDNAVYEMVSKGHTVGIFQCESMGMTQLILKLKPSTFEDIIALVALFRPGPLGSGMVDDFVERKHGRQKISYPHPSLAPILKDTYGMILYQEQVQKIAAVLANYSLGEADLLRRAMGKKIAEEMAKQKTRFVTGSVENDIDKKLAEEIFDLMAEFAKYGFNKSHSAAYGLVSYQTAYLKTHFPEEFLAASMTCDMDNTEKIIRYAEDCIRLGFTILPPDINRSFRDFDVPSPGKVGFALAAIKGVGEAVLEPLIKEREQNGPYKSLENLASRINLAKLGKKTLQLLTAAGALDSFGYSRKDIDKIVPELVTYSQNLHDAKSMGQVSLFSFDDQCQVQNEQSGGAPWVGKIFPAERPWGMDDLFNEKKLLGFFLSGHPLDFYKADIPAFGIGSIRSILDKAPVRSKDKGPPMGKKNGLMLAVVALLSSIKFRRTKRGSLMAQLRLEEKGFGIEATIFEDQLKGIDLPEEDTPVLAMGHAEIMEGGQLRFTLESLYQLEEIRQERVKALTIQLDDVERLKDCEHWCKEMRSAFSENQGHTPVSFRVSYPNTVAVISTKDHKVELSDSLLQRIDHICAGAYSLNYHL